MADAQEALINYGAPQINFGEINQAIAAGKAIAQHIAANRLQSQLAQIAQEQNDGTVTGLDGTQYSARTAEGRQAIRGRIIQAYKSVSGLGQGAMLGTDASTMFGAMGQQQARGAQDQSQRAALDMSTAGNDPTKVANAYNEQGTAAGIAGDFNTARAASEQGAITTGTQADNQFAGSSDPTQRVLGQQAAANQAYAETAAAHGDLQGISTGTTAYLSGTAQAAAHVAGSVIQAMSSGNPMAAASGVSALARLYPNLLPQGANPDHPFQYDQRSNSFVVMGNNNQPLVDGSGQAMLVPANSIGPWMMTAATNPSQIPQILMGLYQKKIGTMLDIQKTTVGNAEEAYKSGDSMSGLGLLARAVETGDRGAMSAANDSMKKFGFEVLWKPSAGALGTGSASDSGATTLPNGMVQAPVKFADGRIGVVQFTPSSSTQGATTIPDATFYINGKKTDRVPVLAPDGKGVVQQSVGDVVKGLMNYRQNLADQAAAKITAYGDRAAQDAIGGPQLNFGLPLQHAALPMGDASGGGFSAPQASAMYQHLTGGQGAPSALISVIPQLERSGANAVSAKGAVGQFQVAPATAQPLVDQLVQKGMLPKGTTAQQALHDPQLNQVLGAAVVTKIYNSVAGSMPPANAVATTLAGYNMGSTAAAAWAKGKPFKTEDGTTYRPARPFDMNALPAETQQYIQRGLSLLTQGAPAAQAPPAAPAPAPAPAGAAPAALALPGVPNLNVNNGAQGAR